MARKIKQEQVIAQEEQVIILPEEPTLTRANRLSVVADGDGFKASFYRTHRHIADIRSHETGWTPNPEANKTAQREDFRLFVISIAQELDIIWQPEDMRTEDNRRCRAYPNDEFLIADVKALVSGDIQQMVAGFPVGIVSLKSIDVEDIEPMVTTAKGYDLAKMGIIDGKYEKNGNWAWANLPMVVTLEAGGQEVYVTFTAQLVSGQLKKPASIGDLGFTQTGFNVNVKQSLIEAGVLAKEEPKKSADKGEGKESK